VYSSDDTNLDQIRPSILIWSLAHWPEITTPTVTSPRWPLWRHSCM